MCVISGKRTKKPAKATAHGEGRKQEGEGHLIFSVLPLLLFEMSIIVGTCYLQEKYNDTCF